MRWLKSKRLRLLLGIVAALVVIIGVSVFALTRGYLIHFEVNDTAISRDEFYQIADRAAQGEDVHVYCTSGAALGFVYLWEAHCYSTEAALDAYMHPQSGSS